MSERGERLINLVLGLLRATEEGSVQWKRTDAPETFVVTVPSGTVTVAGPRPATLTGRYPAGRSLKVRDRHGNEAESVSVDPVRSTRLVPATSAGELQPSELVQLDELLDRLLRLIPASKQRSQAVVDDILRDLNAS